MLSEIINSGMLIDSLYRGHHFTDKNGNLIRDGFGA